MKKNGFIFMESLTVLIVTLLATTLLLSSYSLYVRKAKEKESYDLPSDRYQLFNIATLGKTGTITRQDGPGFIANRRAYDASTNPYGCEGTPIANRLSNCRQVFIDNNLVYYILIYDIVEELSKTDVTTKYDSGTIEYLKTLRKYSKENYDEQKEQGQSNGYIVGVFYKNGTYRYASIPLYSED